MMVNCPLHSQCSLFASFLELKFANCMSVDSSCFFFIYFPPTNPSTPPPTAIAAPALSPTAKPTGPPTNPPTAAPTMGYATAFNLLA